MSDKTSDIKLPIYSEGDDPSQSKSLLGGDAPPQQQFKAVSAQEPKKIHPGIIISVWIALSSGVILQNAYILRNLQFNYPIFLTTFHLVFASIGTRLLHRFTNLLDGVKDIQMTWDRWFKNIVPIGALFSASLIFNNLAYLTLNVSFIQMLKAFTSVAVLSLSVVMGLEKMNPRTFVIVIAISSGVALASYGEVAFDLGGFFCQCLGIAFEATRLVTIQKLLHGMKMSPLVSLYYFAPVCAGLNMLLIPFYEGWAPFEEALPVLGAPIMLGNAMTAFLLNCIVVFLIGSASSLVLTLSGVIKDILLVIGSVVLMGAQVTFIQMVGYSIALCGLVVFKSKQEVVDQWILKARSILSR